MNFQACDKENERNMDIKRHVLVLRQLCCCHLNVLNTHGNTSYRVDMRWEILLGTDMDGVLAWYRDIPIVEQVEFLACCQQERPHILRAV